VIRWKFLKRLVTVYSDGNYRERISPVRSTSFSNGPHRNTLI
jgi:hypothetical protein